MLPWSMCCTVPEDWADGVGKNEMCPTACVLMRYVAVEWLMFSSRPGAVKNFHHHQDMSRHTQAAVIPSGGLRPVNSGNNPLRWSQRGNDTS
jgi:hypothetical protein